MLEKVHVALIKLALLQRCDHLALLDVFNRTKQAAVFNDNLPLATCINEVICEFQKLRDRASGDPNFHDVMSLLLQQWRKRAYERKALRERIEAVSMFHHSIENEVGQQLTTKHHIASTFFVRAVIATNEDLIAKFVHSLSVIPEPSGASKVPFWVRTFLTKNEHVLLLLERKRQFTQFVSTVIEKQRQLEPRTPASALISIERYLHSRVYSSFLLNVPEDEELLSVMTSHQPKGFSHWWIDPVFEDSKKPFDGNMDDSSLKTAIKVFKEMLVLRNPYDKFKCLLRLRNIIMQLFTICGVEISSDSISKTLRYIMWRAKPSQLLANMQYIFLFLDSPSDSNGESSQNNTLTESVELGSENEKVSSDFEFCVKALLMIAEELPRR